jgi:hypothetical protein
MAHRPGPAVPRTEQFDRLTPVRPSRTSNLQRVSWWWNNRTGSGENLVELFLGSKPADLR